jgi:hypothetical protein
MIGPSRELLVEQLQAAIADCESGRDDPFEVAVLAGLLSRRIAAGEAATAMEQQTLAAVRRLQRSGALAAAFPDEDHAADVLAHLQSMGSDDYEEDRCDALFDLDDLCAGAWFLGQPERYANEVAAAVATIGSAPEIWSAMATAAEALLEHAAPLSGDPALALWHCVASCRREIYSASSAAR